MIKFSSNLDFDFGIESVQIITDTKQLTKRASAIDRLQYEKTPNQSDLHLIAVGAYEGTGCFFAGAPVKTFTKQTPIEDVEVGDLVLTHKNRYRKVIHKFEDSYSGIKTILDVRNLPEYIESTGNHPFLVLRGEEFKEKHRCPSLMIDPKTGEYRKGKTPLETLDEIIREKANYVAAQNILPGDYVFIPVQDKVDNAPIYTDDEAYLFGAYLAEGCLSKEYKDCATKGEYKSLLFTMSQNDRPLLDKLKEIFFRLERSYSEQPSLTSDFGVRVALGCKEYATQVNELFGCDCTIKFLHPYIFSQSLEWKLKFLATYFDGDGSAKNDATNGLDRYIGTLTGSTSSRYLAFDIQRLLASCGISSSIYKGLNKHSNGCFGKTDNIIYAVSVGGSQSSQILQYSLRLSPVKKEFKYTIARGWVSSDYLVLKVNSVTNTEVENKIKYNLEIEEDNTYVVDIQGHNSNRNMDSFSEHDCITNHHYFRDSGKKDSKTGKFDGRSFHRHHKNKPNDPKFGNIKAAAYNNNMKRIELIVGLDNDKCADILDELEKKGQINVSMASRQKFDVCSWCGHEAKSDADRCEHIPKHLGELNKHGEQCRMSNPDPVWFELSHVGRGADRIGMSLRKLGGDNGYQPKLPKDYLKIYTGFQEPIDDRVYISKSASVKRNILTKLAALEKHVDAIAKGVVSDSKDKYIKNEAPKAHAYHLSDETIDELRRCEPSRLLKALADKGIVFSPEDFVKYLFDDRVGKDHVEGMKSHLPSIFSDLESDDEGKGEIVNSEKFEPSSMEIPAAIKDLVSGLFKDHSLLEGPSRNRIIRITIIGGLSPKLKDSLPKEEKSKEAFDRGLAHAYTGYKIACANYLQDNNKLDSEFLWNMVIQNRI